MTLGLDTRVIRILRWLLDQDSPRSTAALARDLGLSQRVVRYRLGAVESTLARRGLTLVRQRGAGVWIDGDEELREELRAELTASASAPRVYAPDERVHLLLAILLWAAPDAVSLAEVQKDLEVSKASARRDLRRCEPWLEQRRLPLVRRPGVGVMVVGPEAAIRHALVQLIIEAVPGDVLDELRTTPLDRARLAHIKVPAGMRDNLARLPLRETTELLDDGSFAGTLTEGNSELVFALYLAVTAARLDIGCTITMEAGQHRSLVDHPVSETAAPLAMSFASRFGVKLPDLEVAGLTEYLLGLASLAPSSRPNGAQHQELVERLLESAAERLHVTLRHDPELQRGLDQHLDRLSVRLRYGLPVHNPLLKEIAERYPDVHATACDLGEIIAESLHAPITDGEIGYITMYLAGALERSKLRPGRRAIVICPSGMATAWVLVSRLQAEFPQLEVTNVVSARSLDDVVDPTIDLVISTVAIESDDVPVVVVSPLLTPNDMENVAEFA